MTDQNKTNGAEPHVEGPGAAPHVECGAKKKRGPGNCTKPAGWRTSHPGQGKCRFHGGATPIKHGLFSKIQRQSLREHLMRIEQGEVDRLDLTPEVNLLRAFIADHLASFSAPSVNVISMLADKVGALVDRIQKHKQAKSVSFVTLNRVMEQMGVEVVAALQEVRLDAAISNALCEVIERRWGSIKLDAFSASGTSTNFSHDENARPKESARC